MVELRSIHLRKKECEGCKKTKALFDFYKETDKLCVDCTMDAERKRFAAKAKKRNERLRENDPFRLRSPLYLAFIRGQPCLHCGLPGEAHHIQYAQPRALGRKTGDQFVVPVCHACHMKLHNEGVPERTWWALRGIDPMKWAEQSYEKWSKRNANPS